LLGLVTTAEVKARLERLDLPFNAYGLDPFGVSKEHLGAFFSMLGVFHKHYFRVRAFGIERVPSEGRLMFIGNHSGGLPADAGMIMASLFFDHDPPLFVHGMVEKFAQTWPVVSPWFSRLGQFSGLPEDAIRLLQANRRLMVFPEGARGTGKLYRDRYHLVKFGTGFMRVALQPKTPLVPMAFIGGEEALPTVFHARRLAKLVGAPYWPVPPYLVPMPLPLPCEIHFADPIRFDGTGNEPDEVIEGYVAQVRQSIETLIEGGRRVHGSIAGSW